MSYIPQASPSGKSSGTSTPAYSSLGPLFQKSRPVATPCGALAALWGDDRRQASAKELKGSSAPAPPGSTLAFQAARGSLSPGRPPSGQFQSNSYCPPPARPVEHGNPSESSSSPSKAQELLGTGSTPSSRPPMGPCAGSCMRARSTPAQDLTPSRQGFPEPQSPTQAFRGVAAARQDSAPPRAQVSAALARQDSAPPLPQVPALPSPGGASHGMEPQTAAAQAQGDLIHQHVLYILRKNPELAKRHKVLQVTEGVYLVGATEVNVEWIHAAGPGQRGHLIAVDGPMRQPLVDYLRGTEVNKDYDTHSIACTTSLHHVPKDRRMTFDDTHKQYTRLEAMKVAKEQASIREQAANYTQNGKQVPDDLVNKYNKVLRQKLRHARSKEDDEMEPQQQQVQEPQTAQAAAQASFQPPPQAAAQASSQSPPQAPAAQGSYQPPPQATAQGSYQPPQQASGKAAAAQGSCAAQSQAPGTPVREARLVRQPSAQAIQMAVQAQAAAALAMGSSGAATPAPPQSARQTLPSTAQQEPVVGQPFPVTVMSQRGISLNGVPGHPQTSYQQPLPSWSSRGFLTPRGISDSFVPPLATGLQTSHLPVGVAAFAGPCGSANAPQAAVVGHTVQAQVLTTGPPPAATRQQSVSRLPASRQQQPQQPQLSRQQTGELQYWQELRRPGETLQRQSSGCSLSVAAATAMAAHHAQSPVQAPQPPVPIVWRS